MMKHKIQSAFKLTNLGKKYPEFELGPLNLELEPGTILGFVGPNGAGKTTTIQCLMGLIRSDDGKIEIFGQENDPDDPRWKFDVGYVGDTHTFYERWSCRKNLEFLSHFYPNWSHKRVEELAKRFNLNLTMKASEISKGNRVKLSLISALAHSPKLLLFDEPTVGLDPVVRTELLDVLFEVVETGERAIFYSTHVLSDISRLADALAFLRNGQLILKTQKEDLTEKWRKISFRLEGEVPQFENGVSLRSEGKEHQVISSDYEVTLKQLGECGAENVHNNRMSIEEIAVQILKEKENVA